MCRKYVSVLFVLIGLFILAASPASANQINSATISANCNGYTITVSGSDLDIPNVTFSVDYIITVTPDSGSPFTVSDSVPVTPDANLNFTASVTKPAGPLTANYSLSGTATLLSSDGTTWNNVPITFTPNPLSCGTSTPPPCSTPSSNVSNFNGTQINGGTFIWFNTNFSASGIPSSGATITFTNSTISFTADQQYNLSVPNAQIIFSPSASCASTTFDTITNTWMTTVPVSGDDEIFLSGLAFPVPASFGKVNGNVDWQGSFSSNVPGVSVQWKWGAAVYSSFSTDYNALAVKASHHNPCTGGSADHAGTPEGVASSGQSFKSFVIGGARGGGGSNFTGSWSGTAHVTINCP